MDGCDMPYVKALYLDGKIVTGVTHGHAFAELSLKEKEHIDGIVSGFFDEETGQFIDPDNSLEFYTKSIILIRHGNVAQPYSENLDPDLSEKGVNEVKRITYFLQKRVNLQNTTAYVSPYLRCRHTAQIIADHTRIKIKVSNEIREESQDTHSDFFTRLKDTLDHLPAKSLLISHSDVIEAITRMATGIGEVAPIPTASVTLISKRQAVCLGFKY
jgi:broad specificity phosphatase PhoE